MAKPVVYGKSCGKFFTRLFGKPVYLRSLSCPVLLPYGDQTVNHLSRWECRIGRLLECSRGQGWRWIAPDLEIPVGPRTRIENPGRSIPDRIGQLFIGYVTPKGFHILMSTVGQYMGNQVYGIGNRLFRRPKPHCAQRNTHQIRIEFQCPHRPLFQSIRPPRPHRIENRQTLQIDRGNRAHQSFLGFPQNAEDVAVFEVAQRFQG